MVGVVSGSGSGGGGGGRGKEAAEATTFTHLRDMQVGGRALGQALATKIVNAFS